jgi:hypothetical protein
MGYGDFADGLTIPADRHPSTRNFAKMFKTGHLTSEDLKGISEQVAVCAQAMVDMLPDGPELSAGLRKLWEAKNDLVMAAVLDGRE